MYLCSGLFAQLQNAMIVLRCAGSVSKTRQELEVGIMWVMCAWQTCEFVLQEKAPPLTRHDEKDQGARSPNGLSRDHCGTPPRRTGSNGSGSVDLANSKYHVCCNASAVWQVAVVELLIIPNQPCLHGPLHQHFNRVFRLPGKVDKFVARLTWLSGINSQLENLDLNTLKNG